MKKYLRTIQTSIVLVSFFLIGFGCEKEVESNEKYVILVSFDGCRWDYPDMYDTPNFRSMAEDGVRAERVISSFPTKTFPNHYSIATGLYPDHHGIVNNTFYEPELKRLYRISDRDAVEDPAFYGGDPIWNLSERQGITSASFFWVGSEAPIGGSQPTYWKSYDGSVPFEARVDTVIDWLKFPIEKRPRLILLYFQQPDGAGHDFGPENARLGDVMESMDDVLGYLLKKLDRLGISDNINLIVTSDHGMAELNPEKYINVYDHIQPYWIDRIEGGNPVFLIDPAEGFADSVKLYLNEVEGVEAYKREEIPKHLHYGSNPRIPEILLLADSTWSVGIRPDASRYTGGGHGYDAENTDMHHIFYAKGPDFKKGYVQEPFENVDIYPLVAHLLELEISQIDGRLEDVRGMLK